MDGSRPREIKLADYASAWITQRPGPRVRTVDLYSWLLAKHIAPYLGGVPIGELYPPMIRKWRADLLGKGVDGGEDVSAASRDSGYRC